VSSKPIGILYEHPEWFKPLFAELDRRGLAYERILAHEHAFDPSESEAPYSMVVNRVSPSSYLRGHTRAILYAAAYLDHLEAIGVPVVNGSRAYALEISKARQLALLARLGLPHPRSRAASEPRRLVEAATKLASWRPCSRSMAPPSSRSTTRPRTAASCAWKCSTASSYTPSGS
jgi:hypothetical protein